MKKFVVIMILLSIISISQEPKAQQRPGSYFATENGVFQREDTVNIVVFETTPEAAKYQLEIMRLIKEDLDTVRVDFEEVKALEWKSFTRVILQKKSNGIIFLNKDRVIDYAPVVKIDLKTKDNYFFIFLLISISLLIISFFLFKLVKKKIFISFILLLFSFCTFFILGVASVTAAIAVISAFTASFTIVFYLLAMSTLLYISLNKGNNDTVVLIFISIILAAFSFVSGLFFF